MPDLAPYETHAILNQSPPYEDVDLFASDQPLQEAVCANGGAGEVAVLHDFGRHWGSAAMMAQARLADENVPRLHAFDARGYRQDIVAYHPAYHHFMRGSIGARLHAMTWNADGTPAQAPNEVARAARYYMVAQIENGHMCPITMTRASVAALAAEPDVLARFLPKILSRSYDPTFRPWWDKSGLTLGMGMTEKQGGTDVRANATRAVPSGDGYLLTGHKWFLSAPMCDAFLVLAQAPGGLACFLLPRFRPDGSVNALRLQRLKNKLGNRSNASAEVEFAEAFAWRVGPEGRGVPTIIEMVQLTRLDCAIASAGLMRMALAQAMHHACHRMVFQKRLADQPIMRAVLADMALEMEGVVALVMRLARSFDLAATDAMEAARARLLTPAVKYWVCKMAPAFVYEAMECLGGNGYVEDGVLARLYREAPVNAIWEGSGNVMCLDVRRAFSREPDQAREILTVLGRATAELPGAQEPATSIADMIAAPGGETHPRTAVERLAFLAATAALAENGGPIAALFAQSRLGTRRSATYGTAPLDAANVGLLIERALRA